MLAKSNANVSPPNPNAGRTPSKLTTATKTDELLEKKDVDPKPIPEHAEDVAPEPQKIECDLTPDANLNPTNPDVGTASGKSIKHVQLLEHAEDIALEARP